MKTAISMPDPLFEQAGNFAQEYGLSRSELYAKASLWKRSSTAWAWFWDSE